MFPAAIAAAMQPNADRALIAERLAQLDRWAANAPSTFASRAALVLAELARIDGDSAVGHFERAIALGNGERPVRPS